MKIPSNLLCVKSIITIVITFAFCVLTFLYPAMYEENFKQVVTMIVSFYFAHQYDKINNDKNKKE